MPQYLSTDPNAGAPQRSYVSTDPNAGAQDGKSISGFLANIPQSAVDAGGTIADALNHPVRTLQTIGQIVGDLNPMRAATQAAMKAAGADVPPNAAEAVLRQYAERYSPSQIGDTLYRDPVGVALDASAFVSPSAIARGTTRTVAGAGRKMVNLPLPIRVSIPEFEVRSL